MSTSKVNPSIWSLKILNTLISQSTVASQHMHDSTLITHGYMKTAFLVKSKMAIQKQQASFAEGMKHAR